MNTKITTFRINFIKYIIIVSPLLIIGCGGSTSTKSATNSDGSAKDPYKIVKATYSLNGSNLPTCNKPGYIFTSKAQKETDKGGFDCTWLCAEYEGAKPISVTLSFDQNGKNGVWEFEDEFLSTAPAECHK